MFDSRSLLMNCFALVFPELKAEEIPSAAMTSVSFWDSLRSINLIAIIEEEFGIQVPPEDLAQLVSFESVQRYLQSRTSGVLSQNANA